MGRTAVCQRATRRAPNATLRGALRVASGHPENAVISSRPEYRSPMNSLEHDVARTILDGFDKHYRLFRQAAVRAKVHFEAADWTAARLLNHERIHMYDQRVVEAVATIADRFPQIAEHEELWAEIKSEYVGLLYDHLQPECAETFYNSVACSVLDRRYYRNEFIFWRPAISTEHLDGEEPTYSCYYPAEGAMEQTLRDLIAHFGLLGEWADFDRDVSFCSRAVSAAFPHGWQQEPNFQLQILSSLFYRNKAAYLIGRAVNGAEQFPFVIPILMTEDKKFYLDALLLKSEDIGRIFSLARAYFMTDMEVPSAYVEFLKELMPSKPRAELYTMVGLQKQGKTLFYRDLFRHFKRSTDHFTIAPGTKGMVMVVFTLPSFPYVFKIIRDSFAPPKDTDKKHVKDRYLLVKQHDRVGRMADTLEYSLVALPANRFDPALLDELRRLAPSCIEEDGENIVIKHLYVERRMVPLNMYLQTDDEVKIRHAITEYGRCVKELSNANIFPGDLFTKNFGVTRYGRVVFYDYDEIVYLTDCNFRYIPDDDDGGEPRFSIGQNDIFPEQFPTFLFPAGKQRGIFRELHGDLADPRSWTAAQERCRADIQDDIFPYAQAMRFCKRFGDEA